MNDIDDADISSLKRSAGILATLAFTVEARLEDPQRHQEDIRKALEALIDRAARMELSINSLARNPNARPSTRRETVF